MRFALALVALVATLAVQPRAAADAADTGRFVWRDLMTTDVDAAKRFYSGLFGWRFENTKRGDRPYVLARIGDEAVAGMVDVSAIAGAGPQWISFMAVSDVDQATRMVKDSGGTVLLEPREVPTVARAAVIADPQGAPLGLAQLHRTMPDPDERKPQRFFWQEYLARDAAAALGFYRRLGGYESAISDTRLGFEYHVLRTSRPRAGLFQLPAAATDVLPNWLPYVLVDNPAAIAQRVAGLGGRILVPAAQERRNGSLVVIADPGGAPVAIQKFPF